MSESTLISSLKLKKSNAPTADAESAERIRRLEMRVEREHAGRHEAERLLESKSLELFDLNRQLGLWNEELERRVATRTEELNKQRLLAEQLVATDYLTGLASRAAYVKHIDWTIHDLRPGSQVGLLLLDIDNFKQINDSLGHMSGDDLLIAIAQRLQNVRRAADFVARLGGDEFAIVFTCDGRKTAWEAAERVLAVFSEPFSLRGGTISSSASIGIALYPRQASSAIELQQFADLALYHVKASGRKSAAIFDRSMLERFVTRLDMEQQLRQAIDENKIDVWYQPIVRISTGKIVGVEALARWQNKDGKMISPELFIPLAEECNLIESLGRRVLARCCQDSEKWLSAGSIEAVTANFSPIQFRNAVMVDEVLETLERSNIDPARFIIEITESFLLEESNCARKSMGRLRDKGVRFALDDFGSGYSNLRQLGLVPISVLKIDRGLLRGVENNGKASTIYQNVVSLGISLGMQTVSEGVETQAQLDFVIASGGDLVQGYFFGKPSPADKIGERLKSN